MKKLTKSTWKNMIFKTKDKSSILTQMINDLLTYQYLTFIVTKETSYLALTREITLNLKFMKVLRM